MGYPLRLELIREGLLVKLVNHDTIQGAPVSKISAEKLIKNIRKIIKHFCLFSINSYKF